MLKIAHTICPSCSVGCGVNHIIKNQKVVGTFPYKRHPINQGKNCKKGRDSFQTLTKNRLENPLMKKDGFQQVSWEYALNKAAHKLKSYPAKDIGIIVSGNCTNEEYETLKKLADALDVENIGCNVGNVSNFEIETANFDDVENSDIIMIIGNVLKENPLLGRRIILAKEKGAEIINIDNPEKTLTGINSHQYLKIESTSSIQDNIENSMLDKLTETSTVIIGQLENKDKFIEILKFFQQTDAKILPVMENCNSQGAMNNFPSLTKENLKKIAAKAKILFVLGDDPASYMEESLKNVDFLISQGCFVNDTVLMADLVLPGSCWVEKSGSFTNTTGNRQEFKEIIQAPGNAMDDKIIIINIAKEIGIEL